MKVTIIGAGVAGLALGIMLDKLGVEYSIYEKTPHMPRKGHSFLINQSGFDVLKKILSPAAFKELNLIELDALEVRDQHDQLVNHVELSNWYCVRRADLIAVLWKNQAPDALYANREFEGFNFKNGVAQTALFDTNEIVSSDVFIGADGANSIVRKQVKGDPKYSQVEYKEVIGRISDQKLIEKYRNKFVKYNSSDRPLNFAIIQTNENELIWVCQLKASFLADDLTTNQLKRGCQELYSDFPSDVVEILHAADFDLAYVWKARDFDIQDSFHCGNVMLIGDAAHVALPFTSSGISDALTDASALADLAASNKLNEEGFKEFYELRRDLIDEHLQYGRELKNEFLNSQSLKKRSIPLVKTKANKDAETCPRKVEFKIFTDPLCSTCWLYSAELKKFLYLYKDFLNVKKFMGGLLPSWRNYFRGPIKTPSDVYYNWKKNSTYNLPLVHFIWNDNPIKSSFPACIFYKAIQRIDSDKALLFYRLVQENIFLYNNNIDDNEILFEQAEKCNLRRDQIIENLGRAQVEFEIDLALIERFEIKELPSYVIQGEEVDLKLRGGQKFEALENALLEVDNSIAIRPGNENLDPLEILNYFGSLTDYELSYISGLSKKEVNHSLNHLMFTNATPEVKLEVFNKIHIWSVYEKTKSEQLELALVKIV